jgi:hypothetical protein
MPIRAFDMRALEPLERGPLTPRDGLGTTALNERASSETHVR